MCFFLFLSKSYQTHPPPAGNVPAFVFLVAFGGPGAPGGPVGRFITLFHILISRNFIILSKLNFTRKTATLTTPRIFWP